jgi:pimeloyl-ACP methyl ester carboxylesterase
MHGTSNVGAVTRQPASRQAGRRHGRRRRLSLSAMAVLPVALIAAACTSTGSGGGGGSTSGNPYGFAPAAQSNGPNGSFYQIPLTPPAGTVAGQLLYYEPQPGDVSQLPNTTDWQVAYASTDAQGNPDVVTGTVIVPTAAWTGTGPRPIVDYAVGTQGLGPSCAPSRQFNAAGVEYEDPNINAALAKGYAVVVTDYQWEGPDNTPPGAYVVGRSEGQAVLDMAKVGQQIPGSGLSYRAPVIVWGYSQGGGAATWAGQLAPTYAPQVNLVGVAAGGVPGDLVQVGENLNGGAFAAFLGDALVGFHDAYPALPWSTLITPAGVTALDTLVSQCLVTQLTDFAFQNISTYVVGNPTLPQLLANQPQWVSDLEYNSPGQTGAHIGVPVFMYRADLDEVIPTTVEDAVYHNLCASGTVIQSATYPGDHALTDFEAQSDALTFIGNVLGGKAPTNSCTSNNSSL